MKKHYKHTSAAQLWIFARARRGSLSGIEEERLLVWVIEASAQAVWPTHPIGYCIQKSVVYLLGNLSDSMLFAGPECPAYADLAYAEAPFQAAVHSSTLCASCLFASMQSPSTAESHGLLEPAAFEGASEGATVPACMCVFVFACACARARARASVHACVQARARVVTGIPFLNLQWGQQWASSWAWNACQAC